MLRKAAIVLNRWIDSLCDDDGDNGGERMLLFEPAQIGDVVVSLPYYCRLLAQYPSTMVLCMPSSRPLFEPFTKNLSSTQNWRSFFYNPFYRQRLLGGNHFSRAAISHPNPLPFFIEVLRSINAKEYIIYEGEALYDRQYVPADFAEIIANPYKELRVVHITKHLSVLFEAISGASMTIDRQDYLDVMSAFDGPNLFHRDYMVILTEGSEALRCFSTNKWQEVLDRLPRDLKIVRLGFLESHLFHPGLEDMAGKTTLRSAMEIIRNAKLVVGIETGLLHFAYLSGVPSVCILGGGHFGRFLPWDEVSEMVACVFSKRPCFGCGWVCCYEKSPHSAPCVEELSVLQVIEAIEKQRARFALWN